jgi:hypothetical protein
MHYPNPGTTTLDAQTQHGVSQSAAFVGSPATPSSGPSHPQPATGRHVRQPPPRARTVRNIGSLLIAMATVVAIIAGWMLREEGHLTPKHGLGYWLGIFGAGAMLTLLIYPLRKRMPSLWWLGSTTMWFRIHMLLGILGPLLILYHCNFSMGSLNSTVALVTMLVVAGSGLVGRYLYGKIHVGLDGRKAAVVEIVAGADDLAHVIGHELWSSERIKEQMATVQHHVLQPAPGLLAATWSLVTLGARLRRSRRNLLSEARAIIAAQARRRGLGWWARRSAMTTVGRHVDLYVSALRKAAKFALFERLFALWHILHLPFFALLVLATIAHVIAVHLY